MQHTQLSNTSNRPKAKLSVNASAMSGANKKCQILAKKGFLCAKDLTSDLALLLYSPEFQLGVLLHLSPSGGFGLPIIDGEVDAFAKPALGMILQEFETLGVARKDLLTYVVGGSAAAGLVETLGISVRRMLWNYGLVLSAHDLGGNQIRSIWMDVESGRTIIRSQAMPKTALQDSLSIPVAS